MVLNADVERTWISTSSMNDSDSVSQSWAHFQLRYQFILKFDRLKFQFQTRSGNKAVGCKFPEHDLQFFLIKSTDSVNIGKNSKFSDFKIYTFENFEF